MIHSKRPNICRLFPLGRVYKDNDFKYLADRMDPSKLYILMQHTKEADGTGENFISMLENYMTVNNQNVRKKATRLYNKFVSL